MTSDLATDAGANAIERDDKGVPTAFRLFAPGEMKLYKDGTLLAGEWTKEDTAAVVAFQKTKGNHLPMDCEHFLATLATALLTTLLATLLAALLAGLALANAGVTSWGRTPR